MSGGVISRAVIREVRGGVRLACGPGRIRERGLVRAITRRRGGDHITALDQALAQIPDVHRYRTPIIVRRERPHPGAQLSMLDLDEGMCHQAFLTDTPLGEGSLQQLEVRHRGHARVVDRTAFTRLAALPRPAT